MLKARFLALVLHVTHPRILKAGWEFDAKKQEEVKESEISLRKRATRT